MKEIDQKKATKNILTKRSERAEKEDPNLSQGNPRKTLNEKETKPKASSTKTDLSTLVSGSNVAKEPSEVYKSMVVHYVDDVNKSEGGTHDLKGVEPPSSHEPPFRAALPASNHLTNSLMTYSVASRINKDRCNGGLGMNFFPPYARVEPPSSLFVVT